MGCGSSSAVPILVWDFQMFDRLISEVGEKFDNAVLLKMSSEKPQDFSKFNRMIKLQIDKAEQELVGKLSGIVKKDCQKVVGLRKFLVSTCKAKEGYFRYLNCIHSLRYMHLLKLQLIEDAVSCKSTDTEVLGIYMKSAKGCYSMQGFLELEGLLKLKNDPSDMKVNLYKQTIAEQKTLQSELKILDEANEISLIPLGFQAIRLQAEQASYISVW